MQYTCHLSLWIKQSHSFADRYHNRNFLNKFLPGFKLQTYKTTSQGTTNMTMVPHYWKFSYFKKKTKQTLRNALKLRRYSKSC